MARWIDRRWLARTGARIAGGGVPAALVYALLACALFAPALIGSRVLTEPVSGLNLAPWSFDAVNHRFAYANPELSDLGRFVYAWARYAHDQVLAGHFPAWNPYVQAGAPFFANAQVQLASPFTLPLWIFGFPYSLAVMAALRIWAAAMGTYILARSLGTGRMGAFIAGLAFGACAFEITWASHPVGATFAVLPWMLAAAERALRAPRPSSIVLMAVAVCAGGLAGHPSSFADALACLVVFVVVRVLMLDADRRRRAVSIAAVGIGLGAGLALAAWMLLPVYLAVQDTLGQVQRSGGGKSVPLNMIRTLLYPYWWGRPVRGQFISPTWDFDERTVFVGVAPLILAGAALASRQTWRSHPAVIALLVLGLGGAYGVQPVWWFLRHTPLVNAAELHRFQGAAQLSLALLAGAGIDAWQYRQRRLVMALAGAVIGLGLLLVAWLGVRDAAALVPIGVGAASPRTAHEAAAAAVSWSMLIAAAVIVVTLALGRVSARAVVIGLAVVCVVDLGVFAHDFQQMTPPANVFEPSPAIRFLQAHAGSGRVVGVGQTMPADTAMLYNLRDVRSYDSPQPSLAYGKAWHLVNPKPPGTWLDADHFTGGGRTIINLLGVRYVIEPPGRRRRHPPGFAVVYNQRDAQILVNNEAARRVTIPRRIWIRASKIGQLRLINTPDRFVARRDAVVGPPGVPAGAGAVQIVHDGASRVDINAAMRRGGLVVLADVWADGWSVTIDGHPARPIIVDTILRGVDVPVGAHRVTWSYTVPGLRGGGLISILALLGLIGMIIGQRLFECRSGLPAGRRAEPAQRPPPPPGDAMMPVEYTAPLSPVRDDAG